MTSGLMTVHNNDQWSYIDGPEYFHKYRSWLLNEHNINILHRTTTKVSTTQLDGGSNSHVLTYTIMFTYIRPVKCNVHIINGRNPPAKVFGLVIIKIPKQTSLYHCNHNIYATKPTKKIQTSLKHYNKFISVITEALIWVHITTDTVMKPKV